MSKREQWNVIIAEHIILMHLKLPFQNENTRIHPFGLIPKIEFFLFFLKMRILMEITIAHFRK